MINYSEESIKIMDRYNATMTNAADTMKNSLKGLIPPGRILTIQGVKSPVSVIRYDTTFVHMEMINSLEKVDFSYTKFTDMLIDNRIKVQED